MCNFKFIRNETYDYEDGYGSYEIRKYFLCEYKNIEVSEWEDHDRTIGYKSTDYGRECKLVEECDNKNCIYITNPRY